MIKSILPAIALVLCTSQLSFAQSGKRIKGPVIEDYGSTFSIENPDFKTDPNKMYKVVFDIHSSPENPATVNPLLNTLARFLNMHVQAGVPLENLKVVGVFHNRASKDAMSNEAYRQRHEVDNPNIPLMEELEKAGVKLYMCGQSIYARMINPLALAEPVETALSAMTVFLSLEREGYTMIRF